MPEDTIGDTGPPSTAMSAPHSDLRPLERRFTDVAASLALLRAMHAYRDLPDVRLSLQRPSYARLCPRHDFADELNLFKRAWEPVHALLGPGARRQTDLQYCGSVSVSTLNVAAILDCRKPVFRVRTFSCSSAWRSDVLLRRFSIL